MVTYSLELLPAALKVEVWGALIQRKAKKIWVVE